jgi:twitching motility protein PilT
MESIIKAAVERGASDVHIKAGDVFRARMEGELKPLTKQRLTPEQTKSIALRFIVSEEVRRRIDQIQDYDCSWGSPGIGRFRVNILRQRSSFMIVMRVIPFEVPTLDKLQLPRVLETIAEFERGIVLVTGPTGSGKSATMAGLLNHINTTSKRHIVTLEDPIEFLHRDLNSSVTQREIGADTTSFSVGLKAAMRQDCNVIMIDQLPDLLTVDTALKVGEMGHLLMSTLPTPDATTTIARLVAMFPPDEQEIARQRLANTLMAVVSQRLLPRADGIGRCPVCEVLICTPEVSDLISDRTRVGDLKEFIAKDRTENGMQTFDQHLTDLVDGKVITLEAAKIATKDPTAFEDRFGEGSEMRSTVGHLKEADPAAGQDV